MLFSFGIFFSLFGEIYVASDKIKEDYALQERCGKRTAQVFKEYYGTGFFSDEETSLNSIYTNHYKCFILVTTTGIPKNEKGNFGISTDKILWDINEMKQYGSFFKFSESFKETKLMSCYVLDKSCNSEGEWDSLVKPYMKE